MVRILIVDDHPVVRKGLREIIEETPDMVVTAEAGSGNEALEKIRKGDFDVAVLDISLPGRSGLDVLEKIKHENPELPVLVLSMHPEEQYAIRTLKAGASGYLTKETAPDELIEALQRISKRRKYISPSLAEKLAYELELDSERPFHETLSDREYEVMRMIASGKTVKEIAAELFLSTKTVTTYRSRILYKMRMKNNAELIHYALKNHLIN